MAAVGTGRVNCSGESIKLQSNGTLCAFQMPRIQNILLQDEGGRGCIKLFERAATRRRYFRMQHWAVRPSPSPHTHTRLFAMRLLPDQINVVSCTRTKPANLGQEAKLQNASSSGNQLQHQHKHQNQHLNLAASLGQLKSHIKFIWPSSTATSCKWNGETSVLKPPVSPVQSVQSCQVTQEVGQSEIRMGNLPHIDLQLLWSCASQQGVDFGQIFKYDKI